MAQLELLNLSVHFGGVKAVQNVSIRVEQGEFRGLIGPNGAGKTTVFNAITGVVQPTAGDVYFEGQRLNGIRADKIAHMGIARTFQNIRIYPKMTAAENVAIGLDSYPSYNALSAMLRLPHVVKRDREIKRLSLDFQRIKRLRNIIICNGQPHDFIPIFYFRCQHDNREVELLPDFLTDLKPVNIRKHDIQYG